MLLGVFCTLDFSFCKFDYKEILVPLLTTSPIGTETGLENPICRDVPALFHGPEETGQMR
jgi:hypothetical protein